MNGGFTLLEALVALLVLVIVVTVVLETQVTTLTMEQAARAIQQVRREGDRIFTEVYLGNVPTNILATVPLECEVTLAIHPQAAADDSTECLQWDIASKVRPSLKLSLVTRAFE